MLLYVNNKNEIKDVDKTFDNSLIELEIDDENNPFEGWPIAKICCYRVNVEDNQVTMMTPYVDTRIIEHISQLGSNIEENLEFVNEIQDALVELADILFYSDNEESE